MVHIFLVSAVALAVFLAGVFDGNVLCMGDDGHVAIEAPHRSSSSPASNQDGDGSEHGPCSDIAVDVQVAVRQTAMGTLDAPTLVPPVLDVALPAILVTISRPGLETGHAPPDQPSDMLGRIRSVVLLV